VDSDESECPVCGNVNPEQIFNIIEAKVVDEFGHPTSRRKTSPEEWYQHYLAHHEKTDKTPADKKALPFIQFRIPNRIKQIGVFLKRDVLSKVSNTQYMLINFLEAPVLAVLLTFFIRFFVEEGSGTTEYIFRSNENIPQYLFISVIVALFFGLTVSSEEIIRDRKIITRESFLNLSKRSYLLSKILVMFAISAVQTLSFVLVGNTILGLEGMHMYYWLMLFSASCFANILGLNISDTFNSAKVIYIIIPILIIPQLLFSGVIVKFDKLHPAISSQSSVPFIGNIMASRWAYEALAVVQFTKNKYDREFYEFEKRKRFANWKKDYWVKDLQNRISSSERMLRDPAQQEELTRNLNIIRTEIAKENDFLSGLSLNSVDQLTPENVKPNHLQEANQHLDLLATHYRRVFNKASEEKEAKLNLLTQDETSRATFKALQNRYSNESLENFVTNKNELTFIIEHNNELVQKKDLIYRDPFKAGLFSTHFYAPTKLIFGYRVPTYWANILVIWGMSLALIILLFFSGLKHFMQGLNAISGKVYKRVPPRTTSPSVM